MNPRPRVRGRQAAAQDVVGGFFADHDRGAVEVAIGDLWEDRTVGEAEVVDADHAGLAVHHGHGIVAAAHAAGATGVVGAFHMFADKAVQLVIALQRITGLDFVFEVGFERLLSENLAGEADAFAEIFPVLFVGHVIEENPWLVSGVGAAQGHLAA